MLHLEGFRIRRQKKQARAFVSGIQEAIHRLCVCGFGPSRCRYMCSSVGTRSAGIRIGIGMRLLAKGCSEASLVR